MGHFSAKMSKERPLQSPKAQQKLNYYLFSTKLNDKSRKKCGFLTFSKPSQSQKSAERKSPKKYFLNFFMSVWGSNPGFSSNKPTHYLLDYGDFKCCLGDFCRGFKTINHLRYISSEVSHLRRYADYLLEQ